MSINITFNQLNQQVALLPPTEQLKLVAHICERLTDHTFIPATPAVKDAAALRQKQAKELLALCDAAAEMWEGEFDSAEDIRRMREERDERVWASK